MPDLTIFPTATCATNVSWDTTIQGSTGTPYTVRWGRLSPRDMDIQSCQYGHTCECKGFEIRRHCKHVKAVEASGARCGWNATLEICDETSCPDCGGPVVIEQVGV